MEVQEVKSIEIERFIKMTFEEIEALSLELDIDLPVMVDFQNKIREKN